VTGRVHEEFEDRDSGLPEVRAFKEIGMFFAGITKKICLVAVVEHWQTVADSGMST
jgi:hypothetical protein